jgi:hypothetical protein
MENSPVLSIAASGDASQTKQHPLVVISLRDEPQVHTGFTQLHLHQEHRNTQSLNVTVATSLM